jgi:methylenetetrahydrofolate dehydrogenase (NADP+)/methenyltetrahydrofolate cyclohydrolase
MRYEHKHLQANVSFKNLLGLVKKLNTDRDVTGFIVQLPLPAPLQAHLPEIIRAIDPKKDVDGFGAYNLGKMFLSKDFEHLPPATPGGIVALLEYFRISVAGKHVVVVGRSNTVGKPIAVMLLNRDATVTICHRHTKNLAAFTRQADILIVAAGKPKLITASMVKKGVVVIDVGTTRTERGIVGDVDFGPVSKKAASITPVPGGVGPMTVASLIRNCVMAKERQQQK